MADMQARGGKGRRVRIGWVCFYRDGARGGGYVGECEVCRAEAHVVCVPVHSPDTKAVPGLQESWRRAKKTKTKTNSKQHMVRLRVCLWAWINKSTIAQMHVPKNKAHAW